MRNMIRLIAAGAFLATVAMADTWTGTISDSMCGAKHAAATEGDMKCVEGCMKKGADAVFVTDGKVLKISADSKDKVTDLVGKKVTVTGSLKDDVVTVEEAKAAE